MLDSTARFSSRVNAYMRTRPDYPAEVLDTLQSECGLNESSVVADIGSGTGILARLFLARGSTVFGVEPNREMREAGEQLLSAAYPKFTSIAATAENTSLPDASVDFIAAGQAFHWFDRGKCRVEFARILRPKGWVALVWNERLTDTTPFLREYERLLLEFSTDYGQVNHTLVDDTILKAWFGGGMHTHTFPNAQHFDLEGLKGRLQSSSYAPEPGHPNHDPMMNELERIFRTHALDGMVSFEYETRLHIGQLH
jgi:ubiquinone/menaquinone biosynthesis C-methylase UbiE